MVLAGPPGCNDGLFARFGAPSDDASVGGVPVPGTGVTEGGTPSAGGPDALNPEPLLCEPLLGTGVAPNSPWHYAQYVWLSEADAKAIQEAESPFAANITLPLATKIGDFFATTTDLNLGDTGRAAFRLVGERFSRPLLGWPFPWATHNESMAPQGASYLLRLEYSDDAIVLAFDGAQFLAFNRQNNSVDLQSVLATPERIAGVYLSINPVLGEPAPCSNNDRRSTISRTFLLGLSGAVKSWSVQSASGQARFDADVDALEQLFFLLRSQSPSSISPALDSYTFWCSGQATDCTSAYLTSLVETSSRYDLSIASLAPLIDELKALPAGQLAYDSSDFAQDGVGGAGGEGGASPGAPEPAGLGGTDP